MDEYISKRFALKALDAIRLALWEIDIPSPTVPEYVEHHEQITNMLIIVDGWKGIIRDKQLTNVVPVVRCKDCIHNNDCDIQYSAQAGENFFCGFGETEKDVREDIYE